jgi:hypothetical protein
MSLDIERLKMVHDTVYSALNYKDWKSCQDVVTETGVSRTNTWRALRFFERHKKVEIRLGPRRNGHSSGPVLYRKKLEV